MINSLSSIRFIIIILFSISLLLFIIITISIDDYKYNSDKTNFVFVADIDKNYHTKNVFKRIANHDPDIILLGGDMTYDGVSAQEIISHISFVGDDKIFPALGNHEVPPYGDEETKDIILNHYNVDNNGFYSFDFKNIHFLFMFSDGEYQELRDQHKFVINDLQHINEDKKIDYIIVIIHRQLYSQTDVPHKDIRDIYHKIFDEYNVDLVLSGHFHGYERTYPIMYDSNLMTGVMTSNEKFYYGKYDGEIFVTSGTGGRDLSSSSKIIDERNNFYLSHQSTDYGFVSFTLHDNNQILTAKFVNIYGNNTKQGAIADSFSICLKTYEFSCKKIVHPLEKTQLNDILMISSDLSNIDLRFVNFTNSDLSNSNFSGLDLSNSIFKNTIMQEANLVNSNISNNTIENVNMNGVNFSFANLTNTKFINSDLRNTYFHSFNPKNFNLTNMDLSGSSWIDSDLSSLVIKNVTFHNSYFENVTFHNSYFENVDFSDALIENSSFTNSMFINTSLNDANLINTEILTETK